MCVASCSRYIRLVSKEAEEREFLNLRIRVSVKRRLELLSEADERSMTQYLERLIMAQSLPGERKK
jgi:hypothetical protein